MVGMGGSQWPGWVGGLSGRDGVGLSGRDGVGLSGRDGGGSQ